MYIYDLKEIIFPKYYKQFAGKIKLKMFGDIIINFCTKSFIRLPDLFKLKTVSALPEPPSPQFVGFTYSFIKKPFLIKNVPILINSQFHLVLTTPPFSV
jgi:hypothetical protein